MSQIAEPKNAAMQEQQMVQTGYNLREADDWWNVVCGSVMRGLVEQLDASKRDQFRQCHLERISQQVTEKGLWMDVEVRLNSRQVPT